MASSAVPALTKLELARLKRAEELARGINAPVSAVMASLKSPADIDVQVLSADVDAAIVGSGNGGRRITIQAQSRSPLDMERYVDFLSTRPHLASAALVHHDLADAGGGAFYKFTVEGSWRP